MVKIMPALTESEESKKGGVTRLTGDLERAVTEEMPDRINPIAEVVKQDRRPSDGEPNPSQQRAKSEDRDQVYQISERWTLCLDKTINPRSL